MLVKTELKGYASLDEIQKLSRYIHGQGDRSSMYFEPTKSEDYAISLSLTNSDITKMKLLRDFDQILNNLS